MKLPLFRQCISDGFNLISPAFFPVYMSTEAQSYGILHRTIKVVDAAGKDGIKLVRSQFETYGCVQGLGECALKLVLAAMLDDIDKSDRYSFALVRIVEESELNAFYLFGDVYDACKL